MADVASLCPLLYLSIHPMIGSRYTRVMSLAGYMSLQLLTVIIRWERLLLPLIY